MRRAVYVANNGTEIHSEKHSLIAKGGEIGNKGPLDTPHPNSHPLVMMNKQDSRPIQRLYHTVMGPLPFLSIPLLYIASLKISNQRYQRLSTPSQCHFVDRTVICSICISMLVYPGGMTQRRRPLRAAGRHEDGSGLAKV